MPSAVKWFFKQTALNLKKNRENILWAKCDKSTNRKPVHNLDKEFVEQKNVSKTLDLGLSWKGWWFLTKRYASLAFQGNLKSLLCHLLKFVSNQVNLMKILDLLNFRTLIGGAPIDAISAVMQVDFPRNIWSKSRQKLMFKTKMQYIRMYCIWLNAQSK